MTDGGVKRFWNQIARWNHHVAICDAPEFRDPATREAAFEEAGRRDAQRMAWFVHPGMRVVDLGCGVGRVLRPLAPHTREVVGVDVSEEMIERAAEYLEDVPNARLVTTDGASLPTLEDGSVDFLYSLLCMIHVDKRSAYRYLREIRRVLRPQALAQLQFQSLLTDEGLAKFVDAVDGDYPLEFYSPPELERLLQHAGLELLHLHAAEEYLFATVVNGSAERWDAELCAAVVVEDLAWEGAFEGDALDLGRAGAARARLACRASEPRTLLATLGLTDAAGRRIGCQGVLVLEPGGTHELAITWQPNGRSLAVARDGAAVALQASEATDELPAGPAGLDVGLLPPGCTWSEETLRRFPGLFASRSVTVGA